MQRVGLRRPAGVGLEGNIQLVQIQKEASSIRLAAEACRDDVGHWVDNQNAVTKGEGCVKSVLLCRRLVRENLL